MSSRVMQLSPRASTRFTRHRISVQPPRSGNALNVSRDLVSLDLVSPEMGFLQSWFAYDSDLDQGATGINWGAISGLALSFAISVSCWAGVAWMFSHVWR
jgi:hypothetical protein